jgi:hypothetical protein
VGGWLKSGFKAGLWQLLCSQLKAKTNRCPYCTVPLIIIRKYNEHKDFRCHINVKVSHSFTLCHIYFISQLACFWKVLNICSFFHLMGSSAYSVTLCHIVTQVIFFMRDHCCCILIKERRCTGVHPPSNLVQVTVTETFQRFPMMWLRWIVCMHKWNEITP